jgi:chorismate mutase
MPARPAASADPRITSTRMTSMLRRGSLSKKAILALKTEDFPGVLSAILQTISKSGANILTISQDMPIHGLAYITMMINIRNMTITLDDLVKSMIGVEHVRKVDILTYE